MNLSSLRENMDEVSRLTAEVNRLMEEAKHYPVRFSVKACPHVNIQHVAASLCAQQPFTLQNEATMHFNCPECAATRNAEITTFTQNLTAEGDRRAELLNLQRL